MNKSIKPIGITGYARSGKDTFAINLKSYFASIGISSELFSIANILKKNVDEECKHNYGISAFTQDSDEKLVIRNFLVEKGCQKRDESGGTYWTSLLQPEIDKAISENKIPIITDIRFDEYGPKDEFGWLKNQGGVLVHLTKYDISYDEEDYYYVSLLEPPNKKEEENDKKLLKKCDVNLFFPNFLSEGVQRYYGKDKCNYSSFVDFSSIKTRLLGEHDKEVSNFMSSLFLVSADSFRY